MSKRYTKKENEIMFHVVLNAVRGNEMIREKCRGAYLNSYNEPILNTLKNYIKNRSDEALLIQVSLVVCGVYFPETKWGKTHKRAIMYREMFENLGK